MRVTSKIDSQFFPFLIETLGMQEGNIAHVTFAIGYPAERYLRIPTRKNIYVNGIR
jgi:hypothetical protein